MPTDVQTLASDITATRSFERIRGVSFLGIVDRFTSSQNNRRVIYSRAEHSLGVLALGAVAASQIALPLREAAHLFAACLVHDIGHPPFSHSLEYAFPVERRPWDHHRVLGEILLRPRGVELELHRVLARHDVSPERVFSIASGEDRLSFFFQSAINLDTLDGINRSMLSFGFVPTTDNNLLARYVAEIFAGRMVDDDRFRRQADTFWQLKGTFYRFLESSSGLANVERRFQTSVRRYIPELDREHFRMTDQEFTLRYPEIMLDAQKSEPVEGPEIIQEFVVNSAVSQVDKYSINDRYVRKKHAVQRDRR